MKPLVKIKSKISFLILGFGHFHTSFYYISIIVIKFQNRVYLLPNGAMFFVVFEVEGPEVAFFNMNKLFFFGLSAVGGRGILKKGESTSSKGRFEGLGVRFCPLTGDLLAVLAVFTGDLFNELVCSSNDIGIFKGFGTLTGDLLAILGVFAEDLFKERLEMLNDPLLVCLVSIGEKSGG